MGSSSLVLDRARASSQRRALADEPLHLGHRLARREPVRVEPGTTDGFQRHGQLHRHQRVEPEVRLEAGAGADLLGLLVGDGGDRVAHRARARAVVDRDLGGARQPGQHGLHLGALHLAGGGAREVGVPQVDDGRLARAGQLLDRLAQRGQGPLVALGAGGRGQRVVREIGGGLALGDREAGHALAALAVVDADDGQLLHPIGLAEERLHVVRVDVLAARRDDDVFLAAHDDELLPGVELAEVAGVQPPLLVDGLRGRLRVARVADHHVGAAGEHLAHAAVVGAADLDLDAGHRRPHVPGLRLERGLGHREHGRRLGEPVALGERQPQPGEQLGRVLGQRRPARDEEARVPPERVVHAAEEEAPRVDAEALAQHAVELERPVEGQHRGRPSLLHPREDAPLQELPERRHADHPRDAAPLEAFGKPLGVELVEVEDARPARERQEQAAGELEGVVQRQHREDAVGVLEGEDRRDRRQHGREVAVREHHALGVAGGAAGVDDAGEVGALGHERRRRGALRRPAGAPGLGEVDEIEGAQVGEGLAGPGAALGLDAGVPEGDARPGRADDVGELRPFEAGIDGDGDGAGAEDREVGDGPGRVVLPGEDDAIAGAHAERRPGEAAVAKRGGAAARGRWCGSALRPRGAGARPRDRGARPSRRARR